ncbi:peptidase [ANME-1 cluster archaeon AG-394-G21]|nr:peptidase [ANME-1 cluster archaeon AG-394-G21]
MDMYYLTLCLYIFLIYWFIVMILDKRGILERYNISASGPLLMIRTTRGKRLLERLSEGELRKGFWRSYANIGTIFVLISMVFMFVLVAYGTYLTFTLQPAPTKLNEPRNVLLLPGLNEFIPLCAWVGFVIALIVHELSHAILGVVEGIKVKSMGLLVAVIPIGAFAELDSEQLFGKKEKKMQKDSELERAKGLKPGREDKKRVATARERTRILSAGVTSNFAVALIAFLLFLALLFSIQPVMDNTPFVYAVAKDSPADKAGIKPEMLITKVDGSTTRNISAYNNGTEEKVAGGMILTVLDETGAEREIILEGVPETEGVWISDVVDGFPAANAGIKSGMCIITMNNMSIHGYDDFQNFMNQTVPGQVIEVRTNATTFAVELEKSPYYEFGFLGVVVANNRLGMRVGEFPAKGYLEHLRSTPRTLISPRGWLMLTGMPFSPLPYGFSTFSPFLSHLYEPVGAVSFLGGSIFAIADVLFWIGWINFYVGLFNCLPMVPFDGGYVFREMLNSILRPGIKDKRKREMISKAITYAIAILIFSSIVVLIAGPYILREIGVFGLIAAMVLIVMVLVTLAYRIAVSVQKVPSAVLIINGATANSDTLRISHHGGDSIADAFGNPEIGGGRGQSAGDWNYLEVRQNGELCTLSNKSRLNGDANWNPGPNRYTQFAVGDELEISDLSLNTGDSIEIVYTQTGDVLLQTTVT